MCYVYAIGLTENLKFPWDNCYIGVTNNIEKRWKRHATSKYTVGDFIRKNNLTLEKNMVIIVRGLDDYCFKLESLLRPLSNTGLNEAAGGKGGFTSYTEVRNKKISKALKGRKCDWGYKSSATKKASGVAKGKNNSQAKKWKILDPLGNETIIEGSFLGFCKENNIMGNVMVKHIGKSVPAPATNGYGGFRPINDEQKQRRENTIGWTIISSE